MPNDLRSDPRQPSRMPRRGLAALVLTVSVLALLVSFKTPTELVGGGSGGVFIADALSQTDAATEPPMTIDAGAPLGSAPPTTPPTTMPPASGPPRTMAPAATPAAAPTSTVEPPTEQVITGQSVRTPFGPVQVQVTLDAGAIADISALQLPYDRSYSRKISNYVEPILREEALAAQDASIDLVSGATYTSTGYAMSLQSALDQVA